MKHHLALATVLSLLASSAIAGEGSDKTDRNNVRASALLPPPPPPPPPPPGDGGGEGTGQTDRINATAIYERIRRVFPGR